MSNKIYWSISILFVLLSLLFLIRKEVVLVEHEQGHLFITSDFTLGWIHSVEKEPWYEEYAIENHQLILKETYFKTYGAGTPNSGTLIETNDGYIHYAINEFIEEVNMIASDNIKTTIYSNNHSIDLSKIVENYTNVSISVQKVTLWQYLRGEKFD
ncbi:MAG: DUF1850 domain-containing protein [Solibacillus sp.]|uniref:DUF1850 domain-containing protein n=1 Tax=Solibacillus sp. TaxID=1909654 RepID=UPI0033160478